MPTPIEVVKELRGYGLEVSVAQGGHWKVRDPSSGAWLFDISKSPSDHNWYWALRQHLRRIGVIKQELSELATTHGTSRRGRKQHKKWGSKKPLIDLDALKIAQDKAAAAGEHIPQLEDIENTTEFFTKIKSTASATHTTHFTQEGVEEAINIMVAKADTPRLNATKQRLFKFFEEHGNELSEKARDRQVAATGSARGWKLGRGARPEFIRIAIEEVAPARGLRVWKSVASGEQSLKKLFDDPDVGLELWTANAIEATMDHIEGMKWGVYTPEIPQEEAVTDNGKPEPVENQLTEDDLAVQKMEDSDDEPAEESKWAFDKIRVEVNQAVLRERYANVLLNMLESGITDGFDLQIILNRLDKLVGIDE